MLTWKQVEQEMENCYQMPGMSIKQHGDSVYQYYRQLEQILSSPKEDKILDLFGKELSWKLPSWFWKYRDDLSQEAADLSIFYWYLKYHDLGKPFC